MRVARTSAAIAAIVMMAALVGCSRLDHAATQNPPATPATVSTPVPSSAPAASTAPSLDSVNQDLNGAGGSIGQADTDSSNGDSAAAQNDDQ